MINETEINAAITELVSLHDMVRWAVSKFTAADLYYGHGTDNALDEAMSLVLHGLHLPPDINPMLMTARLTKQERQTVIDLLVKRIKQRLPAPYLTHKIWFAGIEFYIDERVLIPRSPMAELIENEFEPWIKESAVNRILDLCTGSGCIAVTCAMTFPEAQVDAGDISNDALAVAKQNVENYGLEDQVRLIQSDLFSALKGERYDIIISNPPYVSEAEMQALPEEYQHEPRLGLVAGPEGLDLVIKILQQAEQHLTAQGILIVEVGNSQLALIDKFPEIPFTWLEFSNGDAEVFLLTAEQLHQYQALLRSEK